MNAWQTSNWGTSAMDDAIATYMGEGISRVRPTCEGIASNMKEDAADPKNTINIHYPAFAYCSPKIGGAHQVITGNISICIIAAAVAREEGGNIGFMAHIWPNATRRLENAVESMSRIVEMGATEMILFGGEDVYDSAEVVAVMEGFLAVEDPPVKVVGRDLLRGTCERSMEVGIRPGAETAEEAFFIPTNCDSVNLTEVSPLHMFKYYGAHVAPIETFLDQVKRE